MANCAPENSLLSVVSILLLLTCVTSVTVHTNGLSSWPFQGFHELQELQCSGESVPPDSDIVAMVLYEAGKSRVLAAANVGKRQCSTSHRFVACHLDPTDTRKSRLKVLIDDLAEGQSRVYGCNVTFLTSTMETKIAKWSTTVHHIRTTTTVAPTTTTTTTTTIKPQPRSESPVASGVKSNVQEFQLPISVVIIGLVLLLFFAILCAILVILQCRGKRRRRSRAANRESLLSAKNEPMGEGGYRTPRNIPSYPPGHMPPETPGGNFAMRYQKSIPDTGYVSGSSVYYSEPYGTLDEEMKERLRPNPRMCHIPYDIKGGPLDTSHPQEHSA
ncbi:uncharacterized protein LOC143291754 isoform X10 [Babylonia areolata]|uniref:uncharacterized protein LOC143291754 isoform X10 n=1 Tax=Babylonia areolata TaxID=304850 RepID=UPI003FD63978